QPASGPRVAEIERTPRRRKARDAYAVDAPFSLTEPVDPGAQRFYGLAGVEYVVTLQQSADSGFADGKSAEDQSPMRDRFVARHANATSQCAAPAGDELGS